MVESQLCYKFSPLPPCGRYPWVASCFVIRYLMVSSGASLSPKIAKRQRNVNWYVNCKYDIGWSWLAIWLRAKKERVENI